MLHMRVALIMTVNVLKIFSDNEFIQKNTIGIRELQMSLHISKFNPRGESLRIQKPEVSKAKCTHLVAQKSISTRGHHVIEFQGQETNSKCHAFEDFAKKNCTTNHFSCAIGSTFSKLQSKIFRFHIAKQE